MSAFLFSWQLYTTSTTDSVEKLCRSCYIRRRNWIYSGSSFQGKKSKSTIHCTTVYMLNLPYLKLLRYFQHKFAVLCTSTSHPRLKTRPPFLSAFQSHVKVETFAGQRLLCTFSYFSVILRPWVLIQPLGIELRLSCSSEWHFTNTPNPTTAK